MTATDSRTVRRSSPARWRPRRRGRRLVLLLAVVLLAAIGAATLVALLIPKVEAPSLNRALPGPGTFLIVGSDSRENLPGDLEGAFGSVAGRRADVIMLVRFQGTHAQLLSLPRDLKVEIPGRGVDKVNAAYAHGGADLVVRTVREATGLPVHHYLEMDFAGFAGIVDALGGIDLPFQYAARDEKSGLAVEAGTERVDGATALAYARSRSYQEHRDGTWVSVDADDLGRTRRQQRLVLAILAEARDPTSLLRLPALTGAARTSLRADQRVTGITLLQLGWRLPFLGSDDLETATLPVAVSNEGGISYVVPVEPEATAVLEAFRRGESMTVAAQGLPAVAVHNGNGIPGAAARAADRLQAEGFTVSAVVDAERQDHPTTLIIAPAEEMARARLVAARLGFGEVREGEAPGDADVLVILGLDQPA